MDSTTYAHRYLRCVDLQHLLSHREWCRIARTGAGGCSDSSTDTIPAEPKRKGYPHHTWPQRISHMFLSSSTGRYYLPYLSLRKVIHSLTHLGSRSMLVRSH